MSMLKSFLQSVGLVVLTLYLLGSLGFIDFYLCARPVGQCIAAR